MVVLTTLLYTSIHGITSFTSEIATSATDGEDSAAVVGARTIRREKLLLGISKITLILWAGGAPREQSDEKPRLPSYFRLLCLLMSTLTTSQSLE